MNSRDMIQKIYPLSPMQEGMLLYTMFNKDKHKKTYFEQQFFEINGKLDVKIFEESINKVIERHDVLRTQFIYSNINKPVQVVLKKNTVNVLFNDISNLSQEDKKDFINKFKEEDVEKGFELSKKVPIRFSLFKVESEKYIFIQSFHHILLDGWSSPILINELQTIYNSLINNEELNLRKTNEYEVYIKWIKKQNKKEALKYWSTYLDGYDTKITVPKKQNISLEEYKNKDVNLQIDKETTDSLSNLAKANNVTVNSIFQSIWGILLQRYNNTDDIVFGSVVSGRPPVIDGIENMVGLFINTIPVRIKSNENDSFIDMVKKVQENANESRKYEHESLAEIQSTTSLRNELIDNIFVFENYPSADKRNNKENNIDIKVKLEDGTEQTNYDFNILIGMIGEKLLVKLSYNENVYDEDFVKRISSHIQCIINEILKNDHIKVNEINILSNEEKQKIDSFNDTKADYPRDKMICELFEEQVEKTPDNIAIVYENQKLTYRELNEKSNTLARALRKKGINREKVAAIMCERSLELYIGIFAILKAGGAYLPIDAEYPEERKKYMLQDSGANILLTQAELKDKVQFNGEIININDEELYKGDVSNLENVNACDDLTYVIYTSGTTGKPKGVMIKNRNLVNLLSFEFAKTNINFNCRVLQFTTICFDVSYQEIFSTLLSGGQLYVPTDFIRKDIFNLFKFVSDNNIEVLFLPVSVIKFISGESDILKNIPKCIKHFIAAGEQLVVNDELKKCLLENDIKLHNHYGPSETHVVTTYTLERGVKLNSTLPPIGKPISNTRMYILDKNNNTQPIGVMGELYICGDNLGKGYLGRSELTDEKFIPNPYEPGQKMYKTGDLARWMDDGNIEFIGRIDHQVKIRGFRIELGEVESHLLKHKDIKEAVVVDREDKSRNRYLCAYIVCSKELTVSELREYLSKEVPDYMIPGYFMVLEKMPLTPNGKVNRKALPKPGEDINTGTEYAAPEDLMQEKLMEIWRKVLGVENIGIDDNFFDLGGHSLKAIQVVSIIHKELDIAINVSELFENPTIRQLSYSIKNLKQSIYKSIEKAEECETYEVSSSEKRLYALNQFSKEDVNYNIPYVIEVEGNLDKDKVKEVFTKLIKRHESLRTSFHMVDGEIIQRVHEKADLNFEYCEIDDNEEVINKLIKDFVQPFDLSKAPLLRVKLVKVKTEKYLLMFDIHHIICDGTSMNVIRNEFEKLYKGEELEDLKLQYKDFALWQNELLNSQEIKSEEEYWLNVFKEEVPVLEMPEDYPRPAVQNFEGKYIKCSLNKDLVEKLKELSRSNGTTMYMTLLAAYNVLLSKYSGSEDITVGSPIAGRNDIQLENIIGMFVNTLAMRNYPKCEKSFSEFLQDVKFNSLNAYANQDYPFDKLVEKLDIKKDLSRNALFNTMFSLQNISNNEIKIDNLKFKKHDVDINTAKFDITLTAVENKEEIDLIFDYCTKIFKKETIEKLINHFINILNDITENPAKKICDIDMLSKDERKKILIDFNNTDAEYPKDKTIYELFEEQAAKTPDNIALSYENKELTYKELNEKANSIARILRQNNVGPDKIAAIMMDRSMEMIIGIMAIVKAGGAYLPIDPDYPDERIEYMLEDSKTEILLTQESMVNKVKFNGNIIVIDKEELYEGDGRNLSKVNKSSDIAYIIYTSGSTGKPKGVMIEHRALINRLNWMQKKYPIGVNDVLLQKTPFTFDVSVWEAFWWAIEGSKLVILPPKLHKSPEALVDAVYKNKVTVIHFVPSMMRVFLEYLEYTNSNEKLSTLKRVFIGGEPLTHKLLNDFSKNFKDLKTELSDLYGPTEATIDVTYFDCPKNEEVDTIPIGKPIDNTQMYILDKNNNIQPIGIAGELCIAGDNLARGYLNKPELTKEKFIQNPYTDGRMYRSGDLAKWLPDGNIELIGRMDYQVKIRGFRIELGEIQDKLLKHEDIKDAVVIDRKDEEDRKYLCAYISGTREISSSELREYLSSKLPDYMIPLYFVNLDKIPLTFNGKVDRKSLPEPQEYIDTGVEYEAPQNNVQENIASVWQDILGIDKIGISDNFFALGGDSIKAIQICSRLSVYKMKVNVNELFQNPTVKELSTIVKEVNEEINQDAVEGKIELMPIQKSFLERKLKNMNHYNQAFMLYFKIGFDESIIRKVFTKICEHHDALRMILKEEEGNITLYNRSINEKLFDLNVCDFINEASYEEKIVEECEKIQRNIDIFRGPLVKIGLFKTSEGDHLLISIHHLVIDGVSWRILFEDFTSLYKCFEQNKEAVLPDKTTSLQEWSCKMKEYASGSKLLNEITYWSQVENTNVQKLPVDNEAACENKLADSRKSCMELSEKDTESLLKNTNNAYNTEINDILLCALGMAVKKWTGNNKVLVSVEGHGREEIIPDVNITRTIGWFTSKYPLIIDTEKTDDTAYYIKSVKETIRKIPEKGIGYGILKYITPSQYKNKLNFKLKPEISFNYLGQFDEDVNNDLFTTSKISTGTSMSEESQRTYKIDITGMVINNKLQMSFEYNKEQYDSKTLDNLAESYRDMILKIINHCSEKQESEMTPSDYGCEKLSIEGLEYIKSMMDF